MVCYKREFVLTELKTGLTVPGLVTLLELKSQIRGKIESRAKKNFNSFIQTRK
jgi:hypothetical protein